MVLFGGALIFNQLRSVRGKENLHPLNALQHRASHVFFLEKPRSRRFYGFEETKMPIEKMVLLKKKKICPNKPVDTAGLLV